MKQHHYFYAVPLPQQTKSQILEWTSEIKNSLSFQKWVHPEDVHITLAFLGGTEEDRLTRTNERIHEAARQLSSFSLRTGNLGVFGSPSSPRILWTDVHSSSALSNLRDTVYMACEQEGYTLDKRPFNPHITIARKWLGDDTFNKDKLNIFSLTEPIEFKVEKLVLYRTHPDRTPKYEVVANFDLI